MTGECQPARRTPRVVIVAGAAGSGKSTLGRAVAKAVGAAPLDLDTLTNPLLDGIGDLLPGGHWVAGPHERTVRAGRYAALAATAADVLAAGIDVVLIAPFTSELGGGEAWDRLLDAVAPVAPAVLWLDGSPELLASRRSTRGEVRDLHRAATFAARPVVPHARIDALLSPAQQRFRALLALGHRTPPTGGAALDRVFAAALFDLDGTLADSTAAVLRSWARLGAEFGFPESAVHENHGRPANALLERLLPADRVAAAARRVQEFEVDDLADIAPTPGAVALLASLPPGRAAVVTSGRPPVAAARLAAAGLPAPDVVVTRDDVVHGKPDPEPFQLAAARLGVAPQACVAFEDAPAGIVAAKRAGCTVVAVRGTVPDDELVAADLVIDALDLVVAEVVDGGIRLRLVA